MRHYRGIQVQAGAIHVSGLEKTSNFKNQNEVGADKDKIVTKETDLRIGITIPSTFGQNFNI